MGSYQYQLFLKNSKGEFEKVKNEAIFNENKTELPSKINERIKKEYESFWGDANSVDCFQGFSFRPFEFDEIGIGFDGNKFNFNVTLGLPEYCRAFDGTIVSFSDDEIKNYLKY